MNASFLIAALTLGAPGAKAPSDKDPEIYGTWQVEKFTRGEKEDESAKKLRYTFNRDGTWVVSEGDKVTSGPRGCKIDPKADPPEIDLNTPPSSESPTCLGIYKVERDRLKLCIAYPEVARPTDFEATEKKGLTLIILSRVKAKGEK